MTGIERTAAFDRQNLAAALIILEDPDRYDGLLLLWAEAVLVRLGRLPLVGVRAA